MFKDCKTGGYNLEKIYASTERLKSLILLIAFATVAPLYKGKEFKKSLFKNMWDTNTTTANYTPT